MKNKQPSDTQDLLDQINDTFEKLESNMREALENAQNLLMVQQNLLDREEKRLKHKLGSDYPRVQQLHQQRETLLNSTFSLLEMKQILEKIQPVDLDEKEVLIKRRIDDESGKCISGLEVQLLDEYGEILATKPIATDESGCFTLKIKVGKIRGERTAQ